MIVALAERPRITNVGITLQVFQCGPERRCQERRADSSLRHFSPNMGKDEEGLKLRIETTLDLDSFCVE